MTIKERYAGVLDWFRQEMPQPVTELHYHDPFQLLVAVILSAQCTDKRINQITPALFEAFPDAASMSKATAEEIHEFIKSVSYPNNKTKALMGASRVIMEQFGGQVPGDIDSLVTIPGVGRKTANVVLNVVWGEAVMPVDTHVFRVADRIGLTRGCTTPLATEKTLMRHLPEADVRDAHHWLILHGRYVCKARRPDCLNCGLTDLCRYYQREERRVRREKKR